MEEKSNIEILRDFAHQTNREIVFTEEQYPLSVYRKIPRFKRTVFIPNDKDKTSYFVLFSDPYQKIGTHEIFCGVYIPIDVPLETKINFRKKDILDKLNPFTKNNFINTGSKTFDSEVVTTGNNIQFINKIIAESEICRIMVRVFNSKELVYFSVNETQVDFVPDLNGKSHFCIYNPHKWIFDRTIIERWFEIMAEIEGVLVTKSH